MARSENRIINPHFSGKSKLDGLRKWTISEKGLKKYSIFWICRFSEVVDLPNSTIFWIRRFSKLDDSSNDSMASRKSHSKHRYPNQEGVTRLEKWTILESERPENIQESIQRIPNIA